MKTWKKMLALALALMMMLSVSSAVTYAEENGEQTERTLLGEWNFDDETVGTATLYDNADEVTGTFVEGVRGKALKLSTPETEEKLWLSVPYSTLEEHRDSFTLSLWYNAAGHNVSGENSELFSLYNSAEEKFLFYGVQFDGSANGFSMKWDGTYGYANVIGSYKENEWVNLIYCVDAVDGQTKVTAYVNGVAVEIDQGGEWANSLMSTLGIDTLTIGGKNPYKGGATPNCLFYGLVDEIRLYAGAMSAEEAEKLYEDTLAGETDKPDDSNKLPEIDEANNPVSKLLAEYTFNNENVKDSVGLNHAIFYDNKAVTDAVFTEGVVGRGLQLSTKGTGERYWLSIPYEVFDGNQDTFTISMWYKASAYNKGGEDTELFSFYNSITEAFMFYSPAAVAFQDKGFSMKWNGLNSSYGYANVITPYQENEWVHLVYCVEAQDDRSVITAYINGVAVEIDQGGDWANSLMSQLGVNNFTIGGKNPYKGGDVPMCLFYGAIDEVQIYSGALNALEAEYLYVSQLTAPDPEPQPDTDPEPTPGTDPEPTPGTDPEPTPGTDPTPTPTGTQDPTSDPTGNTAEPAEISGVLIAVICVAIAAAVVIVIVVLKKKKA